MTAATPALIERVDRAADGKVTRIKFAVYRRPLRIFAFGRWRIGRPW